MQPVDSLPPTSVPIRVSRLASITTRLVLFVVVPIVVYMSVMIVHGSGTTAQREAEMAAFLAERPEAAAVVAVYLDRVRSISAILVILGACFVVLFGWLAAKWARTLASWITQLKVVAMRVAHGRIDEEFQADGPREIRSLAASLEVMREGLKQRIALETESIAFERDRRVVETARRMFVPIQESFQGAGVMLEANAGDTEGVSQTFWQRVEMQDGSVLALVGRSITHGTSAAMVTAIASTCLRVHAARRIGADPLQLLRDIHRTLCRTTSQGGELCVDLVHIRANEECIGVFSAGGEGVFRPGANVSITGGGIPLGARDFDVARHTLPLDTGVQLRASVADNDTIAGGESCVIDIHRHQRAA